MAALVVAALAGLFGGGWLSSARAAREGVTVEYSRFARAHAPLELTVEWQARELDPVLWIARTYVDRFDVEEIRPTPAAVTVGGDRIYYTFRARGAGTRVAATFRLKARRAGALRGSLGIESGPELEARQWVFP